MTFQPLLVPIQLTFSPVCNHSGNPWVVGYDHVPAEVAFEATRARRQARLLNFTLSCGCSVDSSRWSLRVPPYAHSPQPHRPPAVFEPVAGPDLALLETA